MSDGTLEKKGVGEKYYGKTNINMNLKKVMMDAENDKKTTDQIDEAIETEMNKGQVIQ